jgi:hypothetical protein
MNFTGNGTIIEESISTNHIGDILILMSIVLSVAFCIKFYCNNSRKIPLQILEETQNRV